jgi:hypothetical protein
MRAFCLLLILTNVLFFTWAQFVDVRVDDLDRPSAASPENSQRIVLARETSGPARPAQPAGARSVQLTSPNPASNAPIEVARADQSSCVSVGPFGDLSHASQAQSILRNADFRSRQRVEQGEIWVGYWVSVQNFATRAAADEALELLEERGITDAYIVPGSNAEGSILSIGVFSDPQRARRRFEEIRTLGLEPQISDRKRPGSVYWLDVDLTRAEQIVDTAMFQTEPGKITRLEVRACPAASPG